ncbi:MAG: hypothetical protein GY765_14375 [bacterium]|nr:hypothetical protein [bacterium]
MKEFNNAPLEFRFHHVAIAVKDMEEAVEFYTGVLQFKQLIKPLEVPPQRVKVCFVEAQPGVMIELVEGLGEKSPIKKVIAAAGAGPYHLCYQVEQLDQAVTYLKSRGCASFKRFEMPVYGLRRFAFMFAPDGQLFELCEMDAVASMESQQ